MEQQIRFCTTSDGVSIAYATLGEGPPLVYATGWPDHLELAWDKPFVRAFLEALAEGLTLIRYDMRGSGLSDPDVSDFSLNTLINDLEAVVEHLALERFALVSLGDLAGPITMIYAATHPERVTHLILHSAFVRGSDIAPPERQRSKIDYVRDFGSPEPQFIDAGIDVEKQRGIREIQEASTSPQMQAAVLETMYSADVSDLLDRLSMPALILHCRGDPLIPFALGRELASRLPQAKFVPYEGATAAPWAESNILLPEIHRFLGVETTASQPQEMPPASPLTILFTDVVGSTALTQRLGDARAQEMLRSHNNIVRDALKARSGSEKKHTGDGIMASFPSASRALEAAIDIQKALADYNDENTDTSMRVRIGLNAGEPVAEDEDLFGTAVQLAARVCAKAEPGQILAADVVQQLAAGKGFTFIDKGKARLKGFEKSVRLHEVRWQE